MSRQVKPVVRYCNKVADFICEQVAEGLNVSQVCRKHPKLTPDSRVIYRWSHKYPEFRDKLNDAYEIYLMRKMEELEELSTKILDLDLYGGDHKLAFEARRIRMDALKFLLGKMAPVLSIRFANKSVVKHEVESVQYIVMDYGAEKPKGNLISIDCKTSK